MHFTEQPNQLLTRLMKHTLDHFHVDFRTSTIVITYKEKTCEVYSTSVEPIYLKAFNAYQEEGRRYQEALRRYEEVEQAYLLNEGVTAEELTAQQQLVQDASQREYSEWYEEVIITIIKDDWVHFERAIENILN